MIISGFVIIGGMVASSWGIAKYIRSNKTTAWLEDTTPLESLNSLPKRTHNDGKPRDTLAQKLVPDFLARPLHKMLKQGDDLYQSVIHNTVDRLFGIHYEEHLQALGGPQGSMPSLRS